MVLACIQVRRLDRGFTLVELLVGLVVAGVLAAMIASLMGESILSSTTLLRRGQEGAEKTTLRRILHRDIKHMQWASTLDPAADGFSLQSGHNMLLAQALPMEVTWIFAEGRIVRREENFALQYSQEQVLLRDLEACKLELMPSNEERWIELDFWLTGKTQKQPRALRLTLVFNGGQQIKIVEHVPEKE